MVDHRDNKLQDYHMQKSAGTQDNSYLKPLRIKDLTNQYASLIAYLGKKLLAVQETWIRSLGLEDPLEKEMATHSRILAWKIPRTEEPGRLQSMGLQSRTRLSE